MFAERIVVEAVTLVNAILPEPKAMALVALPPAPKIPVLRVKFARLSVPAVNVKLFDVLNASPRTTEPP